MHAYFGFLALGAGFAVSITLSSSACHFARIFPVLFEGAVQLKLFPETKIKSFE